MPCANHSKNHHVPEVARTAHDVQKSVQRWREANNTIAFVPTMGNLHAGHMTLVKAAFKVADRVIVSIFVNPAQFGENEDFASYPRTFDEDIAKLTHSGVDMVFAPSVNVIYPEPLDTASYITVTELSEMLEGEFRSGFFTGVATVVKRLFTIVTPDIAVFGEKDYQQLLVIQKMVSNFKLPIKIQPVATVREADGLAMSSRNGYLQADERKLASTIYKTLQQLVSSVQSGVAINTAENSAIERLAQSGFTVDYVSVRQRSTLAPASLTDCDVIVLAAARIGETRLIDNVAFQITRSDAL